MGKKNKSIRVKYQESGSGWGNPLLGRVFDSKKDLPNDKIQDLAELIENCEIKESKALPGRPPTDVGTFELKVESNDGAFDIVGSALQADKDLKKLLDFISTYSREELLD